MRQAEATHLPQADLKDKSLLPESFTARQCALLQHGGTHRERFDE
jgi:hypothetical protein